MATSATITLRDLTTGAGRTGLTVVLEIYSGSWVTHQTLSEVAGKAGVYKAVDAPLALYRLKVGGVLEESFSDINGKYWSTDDPTAVETAARIAADLLAVHLAGTETVTGEKTFNLIPKLADSGGNPLVPTLAVEAINKSYFDAYAATIYTAFLKPGKSVIVDSTISASYTGHYKTIQEAINYCQTQSPAIGNQWYIYVFPNSVGYTENLTFNPYIHLIGVGRVKIIGNLSTMAVTNRLENIYLYYAGNLDLNLFVAYNCVFRVVGSESAYTLQLNTLKAYDCKFYAVGVGCAVTSAGNNVFVNCFANTEFAKQSTDVGNIVGLGSDSADFYY